MRDTSLKAYYDFCNINHLNRIKLSSLEKFYILNCEGERQ